MRTQSICLALAIVLMCPNVSAQWIQTNGPYGGNVTCVGASGTNLFAGTERGGVYLSMNNGTSWTSVNSGLTNTDVRSLAVSGTDLFAGTAGGVFLSTNSGANWNPVNSGLRSTYVLALAVSGKNLFAGTDSGVFVSTNNGTSWTQINAEWNVGFFTDLAVIGTNLFVGGSWGGGLRRCSTNGMGWVVDSLLGSISVFCLAVSGDSLFAATGDGVFVFVVQGTSWTQVSSRMLSQKCVYALAVSGADMVANTYEEGVYLSTNGGLNWSLANSGLSPHGNPYIYDFAFIGLNIFAATSDGAYLLTDNATHWIPVSTGIACRSVSAFAAIPSAVHGSTLWVCAGSGDVYRSTDDGMEWTAMPRFTNYSVFCFVDIPDGVGGTGILAGGDDVFLSTDNGISWTSVLRLSSDFVLSRIYSFAVIGSRLFAGTEASGVYVTTNSGTNWTAANSGLTNLNVMSLAASDTILFAGTGGGVFLSTNYGAAWTPVNNGLPEDIYMRDLAASGSGVFVGLGSGAYLSTNNGSSWTEVNSGLTNHDVIAFAVAPDKASVFAGTWGGGVFVSTNNGSSWTEVNSGLPPNTHVTELAVSGNNLFAGTEGAGVWRRPLSEMITSVNRVTGTSPHEFQLSQNFPNPFNPNTTIQFALPHRSHVILSVYNTLGQQVAQLVKGDMEAGYQVVKFDGAGRASGVYFYRIQAGDFVSTKKLLLLR